MPQIREIVSQINTALQGGNFATQKFQSGKWYGVAQFIAREENNNVTKFPTVIDDYGDCEHITADDVYPIQFYHRILSIIPEDIQIEDFGNPANTITEIDEMILIIFGDRKRTNVYPENIASAVWAQMPRELSVANLQSCIIEPLEVNTDSYVVWASEFNNVDYELEPQQYLISLKYRIVATYSKNCFTICS